MGRGRRLGRDPDPLQDREPDPDADPQQVARTICLQQLTASAKSRAQLEAVLSRRGVAADVARTVLDRLTEVGLVDDAAYARAWVQSRHAGRGLARRALSHELRTRGIDGELAAEALAAVGDDDERVAARRLVDARLPTLRGLPYDVQARRLAGLLARKGYGPGIAFAVVREALGAVGPGADLADDAVGPVAELPDA